jgi:ribosomal protein S18 acetylase RimI-like enzyme
VAEALALHRYVGAPSQVAALREICREWSAGPTGFWPFDELLEVLQRPHTLLLFVAEEAATSVWSGAIAVDIGPYAADILYIYVRPDERRGGLGDLLLRGAIAELQRRPAIEDLFLEVRAGNQAAIALYERLGMERVGVRKAYYRNGDDAVVYRLKLQGDT